MKNENFQNPAVQLNSQTSDKDLHRKFVNLGNDRRRLANQLLAMLPEIFARGIFRKYTRTIEEYAGKFGGLSESVVRKRLRLEKYVYDKPKLKEAIATEGVHKVALVASLATVDNEAAWADKIKNMSKPAIQELSKEVRYKMENGEISAGRGVNINLFENKENENCKTTHCAAAPQRIRIELEGELYFMFLKLKKKYGEKLTNQELMQKIFEENLNGESGRKSQEVGRKASQHQSVKIVPGDNVEDRNLHEKFKDVDGSGKITKETKIPRYIRVHIRRNLLHKMDSKCTYPGCERPAQVFHHTDRFANSHSHESIKPMCEIHHEFAHNGLIQNENSTAQNWQLQLQGGELDKIDQLYRKYRQVSG